MTAFREEVIGNVRLCEMALSQADLFTRSHADTDIAQAALPLTNGTAE